MLTITIEPGVFAPPSGVSSAESVRNYVLTLLHWKSVLDEGAASVLTCRATNDVLIQCECYPFRPRLRTLLIETAFTDYDFNTIAVLADTLIGQSDVLENATGIDDILIGDDLRINPDMFADHAFEQMRSEVEKCAVVVAIIRTASKDPYAAAYGMALRSETISQEIAVDARIEIIDHHRTDLADLAVAPNRFQGSAIVCRTFENFLSAVDESRLWKSARSNQDLETAVKVAIYKSRITRGIPTTWDTIPQFRINEGFYATVAACGGLTNEPLVRSTLRSVVETVEDLQMASTHELRTGAGAENPQKKRGGDLAWRRDITHLHHLHYWRCSTGLKELCCMVAHDCFDISA